MYLRNKLFTTFDKVVRSISYNHCCHCSSNSNKEQQSESPLKQLLNDSASFQDATPTSDQQQWSTLPYTGSTRIRKQGEYFTKEKKDPRDSSIILFPGQGSQFVGMGRDLLKYPVAKDLYELANYVLGYDLLKLCLDGPIEQLNETKYSQPAILVASLAALEKLKEERPNAIDNCVAAAGFSLGEITALIFAGAIGFERGLQLVKIRAEAMQLASALHKGGMATVMYGPSTNIKYALIKAKEWALKMGVETPVCDVANYLFPHCKVIAGNEEVNNK